MSAPVAVFHPGTQHSWQTALALQQLGQLAFYATSIFYQPDRWPYRVERHAPARLRARLHAEFRRFSHPALDPSLVRTSGVAEWAERIAFRGGFRQLAKRIDGYGNRVFARTLEGEIRSARRFMLWGYDNSSLGPFTTAKGQGRTCILDRTNGDFREYNAIMDGVYDAYPEFFLSKDYHIPADRLAQNDREYALADVILTGSPFAAATVRKHVTDRSAADRVRVLNYCFDEKLFGAQPAPAERRRDEPLRFLFVGQAGVRKGIHLVLKVFERIPKSAATLKIVGDLQVPPAVFARYADRVTYVPTVARADVPALMTDADVLLFPSYFEGSALSLIEGLASGMALIQSANAGCGVTPKTGSLLPELTERALYDAVMTAIDDRQKVQSWRAHAQAEASNYSFARYRESIGVLLEELPG
jgi:glycosyltransferase involved in cell wall biosynthesis